MKSTTSAILFCVLVSITTQAQNVSSLDTGAGFYPVNSGAVIVDPNWTVTLLGTDPAGQTPPGGIPTGAAYLVPNSSSFPFGGSWMPNTATSIWLTYASPTPLGNDRTDGTYQYQLTFTAGNSGALGINFLDDNTASLFINGVDLGSNPGNFSAWLPTPISFTVAAGTTYTVDLDVQNDVRDDSPDPTGARVQFSGDISVAASVPEPSSYVLLAMSFGGFLLLMARKNRAA